MKRRYKIAIGLLGFAAIGAAVGVWYFATADSREPSFVAWNENCASCHGIKLEGTPLGSPLVEVELKQGDTLEQLMAVIAQGVPDTTMEAWENKLSPREIKLLAIYISEQRQKFPTIANSYAKEPREGRVIQSQHHDFRLELVTALESRPYSIAPMPGGEILVAEKIRGLSIVDRDGNQSPLIADTPEVWGTLFSLNGAWLNLGTVLDVQLHPDYAENGWIYLSHTDRCNWLCGWVVPGTMVRVVRGRIKDGKWVDQEIIWSVHTDHYTPVPDAVAAGRLAFDKRGYLYISIGGKNTYDKLHQLDTPFGKIHRVRDDGTVPEDNPFWVAAGDRPETSTIHTVWSYGHRTGQGLDGHQTNGEIWNTEMGPRGGDEINHIMGGQNYGWPLYTNGLDYDGEEISIGKDLGLDFAIEDTVLPVVDFTPAPAVSNFTFHHGTSFPSWKNDLLVGTLKASTLYRMRIENNKLIEQEKLITDFGRIRDVEMGEDGFVYIVLEHNDTGSLWRMVPG
ncbi:MAG: PQQ-dependent sugar dehydrogenase [Rhizobiaceae bacterium]